MDILSTLKKGLAKTKSLLIPGIERQASGVQSSDRWEEIEALLVGADMGYSFAKMAIAKMRDRLGTNSDSEEFKAALRDVILEIMPSDTPTLLKKGNGKGLTVILVIGVNGTGKTTTIGKIGYRFQRDGVQVMFAAADTFRAAAIEQLTLWGRQTGISVVAKNAGSDPSAVIFEALQAANSKGVDVLLVDTAGRLHSKDNLMEELKKVKRIIARQAPTASLKTLLVLDATTGQNAMAQAEAFHQAVGIDAIVLTKLDGSAKGGIVIRIIRELNIPVAYIGLGEKIDDLHPFAPVQFVEALVS